MIAYLRSSNSYKTKLERFAMKSRISALVCAWIVLVGYQAAADDKPEVKEVKAKSLTLKVPVTWQPVKLTSKFRAAQFSVPGKKGKDESADLVVYHFGGPTGGIKANVGRWIGQFEEKGRKVELVRGESQQGDYILADISGTWNKPDGPPFAQKKIKTPGSRVIGVIVITGKGDSRDYYFLKFSGPDALVKSQASALRSAIGVNLKSEKSFDLKDAEN